MATLPNAYITPERYLEIERNAEYKSEYIDGQMFAMAGAMEVHNLLAVRAISIIDRCLRGRNCRVYGSDMRVCDLPPRGPYVYPDVTAVCGERRFLDAVMDTLINPTIIIEVLSPSTEAYDRGRKFERYKRIDSLAQYVLVASDRVHVDLFTLQADGAWRLTSASDNGETVHLPAIDCILELAELYENTGLLES